MLLRSDPLYPSDRARLGDYAVRQNHADRFEGLLNAVMDSRFEPVHSTWRSLWLAQKKAETELEKAQKARDEANRALDEVCAILNDSLMKHPAVVTPKRGRTGQTIGHARRPSRTRQAALEALRETLLEAPEGIVPGELSARFEEAWQQAGEAAKRFGIARDIAMETRDERAASDEGWNEAYKVYHLTVEFVARSDKDRIKRWILPWPPGSAG